MNRTPVIAIAAAAMAWQPMVTAGEYEQNLARQLTNPVAALISVPLQLKSPDSGPEGWGFRFTVTFLYPR